MMCIIAATWQLKIEFDDTKPRGDLMSLENGIFIPSKYELQSQRENYITLVSRYIKDEIKCLEFLQCVVTRNIPHRYTEKTKQKTNTVCKYNI